LTEAVKQEGEIREYIRGVNDVQYLTFNTSAYLRIPNCTIL